MLRVNYAECHAECRKLGFYAEWHCAERHYAECLYADCHYAECRGPNLYNWKLLFQT
jgi:hypothetical protein